MMMIMKRSHLVSIWVLGSLVFSFFIHPICANEVFQPTVIEGHIVDAKTRLPIENATIVVWCSGSPGTLKLAMTKTGSTGQYEVVINETKVQSGEDLAIFAYADDPLTPGLDYVPQKHLLRFEWDQIVNVSFTLDPGASLKIEGDIRIVDVSNSARECAFEVRDPITDTLLGSNGDPLIFGTDPASYNRYLEIDLNHVIVPVDTPVKLQAMATFQIGEQRGSRWRPPVPIYTTRSFTIDEPEHYHMHQGQMLSIDVRKHTLNHDLTCITATLQTLDDRLNEIERLGFYTISERQDWSQITGWVTRGAVELEKGSYEASYADLREAYVNSGSLSLRLEGMYMDAKTSTFILVMFFTLTATAITHVIFEEPRNKVLVILVLYPALMGMLFLVYPGCHVISPSLFLVMVVVSPGVVLGITYLFPVFLKERTVERNIAIRSAVVEFFSMAKRNLKRRTLRSTLTLITVMTLVMSFVALTSFTVGYGLTVHSHPSSMLSTGLVIQRPIPQLDPDEMFYQLTVRPTFQPFELTDVDWLVRKPDVALVAPKAENYPSLNAIGGLGPHSLYGYLGILPSVEAQLTRINETIVEGRYLHDSDETVILISVDTMNELNLTVGDTVPFGNDQFNLRVTLVGVFDGDRFMALTDFDGEPVIPQKLFRAPVDDPSSPPIIELKDCTPAEIVILPWQTALYFDSVSLSRLGIIPTDPDDTLQLGRRLALERDYLVWAALQGETYLLSLGSVYEWKGVPVLIPWAIVILNVVVTMLNVLYERRREIGILSAVGLNPSHITWLFLAESVIIGVVGGGIGYLLGLGSYPVMSVMLTLEVRQKISAVWCAGALGIAVTAVFIGSIMALKSSTVITPSLMRRWKLRKEDHVAGDPWILTIPVKVTSSEIGTFLDSMEQALRAYQKYDQGPHFDYVTLREEEPLDVTVKRLQFVYIGDFSTSNELVATRQRDTEIYEIRLISRGEERGIQETANLIRRFTAEWSMIKPEPDEERPRKK